MPVVVSFSYFRGRVYLVSAEWRLSTFLDHGGSFSGVRACRAFDYRNVGHTEARMSVKIRKKYKKKLELLETLRLASCVSPEKILKSVHNRSVNGARDQLKSVSATKTCIFLIQRKFQPRFSFKLCYILLPRLRTRMCVYDYKPQNKFPI